MTTRQDKALKKKELAEQIRNDCRQGVLAPGSLLPTVRDLALKHELSKRVVNEQLQRLVAEGWLRSVPRVGIFVQESPTSASLFDHTVVILSAGKGQLPLGQRNAGWLSHVAVGALQEIEVHGLHAVFLNPERLTYEMLDKLTHEKPLGMLVPETSTNLMAKFAYVSQMLAKGIPVVFNTGDPRLSDYDRVASDAEHGSYMLTRWFLNQGRAGIAMTLPANKDHYWASERRAGYEKAMREAGLAPRPSIELPALPPGLSQEFLDPNFIQGVAQTIRPLLEGPEKMNVILAASDGPVAELEAACKLLGRIPGKDVFLAGYDNYWMDLEACNFPPANPVVTVDRQNQEMGAEMVKLLLDRVNLGELNGAGGGPILRTVLPQVIIADQGQAANVPTAKLPNSLPRWTTPITSGQGVAVAS